MDFDPQPMAWIVSSLFRPTARRASWYPDEVTPTGMTRRLRARAKEGRDWPSWEHPEVQTELIRQMARRSSKSLLPVLHAFFRHFKDDPDGAVRQAFFKAMACDHPDAKRGWAGDPTRPPTSLLERMLTLHWVQTDPVVARAKLDHRDHNAPALPPAIWRELMMGALRLRPGPLPGLPARWCGLIQAMRLENTAASWDDLDDLLTRHPALVWAAPEASEHLPMLMRATSTATIDQRSLDLFVRHGGSLTHEIPSQLPPSNNPGVRFAHEAWNQALTPEAPEVVPETLPLWVVVAMQGHQAAQAWGERELSEEGRGRLTHAQDSLRVFRMDSRAQTLEPMIQSLTATLAWKDPARAHMRLATPDHVGDTHPFWAAVRHESRLLSRSVADDDFHAPGVVRALRQRKDLQQAADSEGGNLWWALIGALDHYQTPAFGVLNNKSVALLCQPDRQGNGVLFRHPDLANLLDRAQPIDIDMLNSHADPLDGAAHNPLWRALQANPDGFFGNTVQGRERTAAAMWKALESRPWFRHDRAEVFASQTLLAFHNIEPESLCPALRLFVAVAFATAMGERLNSEDLAPWMSDPAAIGVDPTHGALVHLTTHSTVFAATLRQARSRSPSLETATPARRRARP